MPEYNYSPAFLKANEVLVRKLVDLARDGGIAQAKFEDYNDARSYRVLVLNLKRSLALNHPDMAYVHNAIRTEITRDDAGWWVINIGAIEVPGRRKKLRGARYEMVDLKAQPAANKVLTIQEEITAENWPDIGVRLAAAKVGQDITVVVFNHPPVEDGIKFIAGQLAPQFTIKQSKPTLVFERAPSIKEASANDALPHS